MNANVTSQYHNTFILIKDSNFYFMNYMSNTTSLTLYDNYLQKQQMAIYSGVLTQPQLFTDIAMNKGIILNLDSFPGIVEIYNCEMNYNGIFIPEIFPAEFNAEDRFYLDAFKNNDIMELEFSACDRYTNTNQYFLQRGIDSRTDINSLVQQFETEAPIFIKNAWNQVIVRDSMFKMNLGTFGGVISYNSPNFQKSGNAYLIIDNSRFYNNLAYFSGGAVFVRNPLKESELTQICGGVSITNSMFSQNQGLKKSNGGAVTIYCDVLNNYYNEKELQQTSRILKYSIGNKLQPTLNLNASEQLKAQRLIQTPFFRNLTSLKGIAFRNEEYLL